MRSNDSRGGNRQEDIVRLTNFFMSAGLDHKKFGHNKHSSLFFMAPERIMARIDLNNEASLYKCDMWSIGVLLYLLLFGEVPFNGSNISKLVKSINKGQASFPEDTPPEFEHIIDLIQKLLVVDEDIRLDVKQALNHKFIT